MDLTDIEKLAEQHRKDRDALADIVTKLHDEIEAARRKYRRSIAARLSRSRVSLQALQQAVEDNPHLFKRPKTRELHGFKVGYQHKGGKAEYDDERTRELIRLHLNDREDELIDCKYSVNKRAVAALDPELQQRIRVCIAGAGDVVIVKPSDDEVDKLINSMLPSEAEMAELEEEAA